MLRRRSVLLAASAAALAGPLTGRAFAADGPVLDHTTVAELDGTRHIDLPDHAGTVAPLSAGTVLVTFRTTSADEAMTLLSASDPSAPSSNVTVNLQAGVLQFSVRRNGELLVDVTTRTRYDDGLRHTVAVTADSSGVTLHAGGRVVFETATSAFFSGVAGLTALCLGGNRDSDHASGEWFFTGTIERAAVWDRVLGESELVAECPRADLADLGKLSVTLNGDTPATWLFTGDSITHGALHTNGWRSYPEHWMERVRWELGKPKNQDFMVDTGVSGATSAQLKDSFADWVTAYSPDVVSIMIGANDIATAGLDVATYKSHVVALTRAVRALSGAPIPVLQSPTPVDPAKWPDRVDPVPRQARFAPSRRPARALAAPPESPSTSSTRTSGRHAESTHRTTRLMGRTLPDAALDAYADAMKEAAAEEKAVFVDHYRDWLPSDGDAVPLDLLSDGLHPNQRGHHRIVLKMIKDLRIFDPSSAVCSLNIP